MPMPADSALKRTAILTFRTENCCRSLGCWIVGSLGCPRRRPRPRNRAIHLRRSMVGIGCSVMAAAAFAQKKPDIPTPHIGTITIDQFRTLEGNTEGYFKSPGPVRIILEDGVTGEKTVIIADDAEGQP